MKYNQPYGMPEEDVLYSVPFVNGDPSIGRAGSIPPAESIEYDQREIIAVIQWAYDHGYRDYAAQLCQAPTNADLTQLLKAIFGIFNSRLLTTPREYWVDGVAGNDANDGLSAAKPFKTLQKAQDTLVRFNLNGFDVTVHVAPATYAKLTVGSISGSGNVTYIGDTTTPSNCTISSPLGACIIGTGTGKYWFYGFKVTALDGQLGNYGIGVVTYGTATIGLGPMEFGYCKDGHLWASNGSYIGVYGPVRITGNAAAHMLTDSGGRVLYDVVNKPMINIVNPITVSQWANVGSGIIGAAYGTITGFGNVTGKKYDVSRNGILDTLGGGVNYLPGTVAGTTSTGGQYL
ncbi:hypothetical protein I6F35_02685 [Bradyrhizobium sp. BRP22]|uniref:hypothetical protein n=1 Tax=Bradyrhizobium sp. BRP22 TaxID=2793821 RepID=UPI001CD6E4FE|nr:hypothetical protein [Bradyrhizobium sp. BRP22]MCA1452120.1 hypothetical protein [Bradyrhizobium sp. BRP22]